LGKTSPDVLATAQGGKTANRAAGGHAKLGEVSPKALNREAGKDPAFTERVHTTESTFLPKGTMRAWQAAGDDAHMF